MQIPEVDLEPGVNELCSSPETVEKLEQCVMHWQTNITVVLEEQQQKKPQVCCSTILRVSEKTCWPRLVEGGINYLRSLFLQTPGPLAEIIFWQERSSTLRTLSEQLKQPVVTKIIEVMTKTDSGIIQTLEGTVAELNKYRIEADDNLRFLSTLERHFMVTLFYVH